MGYKDEEMMKLMEEMFHKIRRSHAGGPMDERSQFERPMSEGPHHGGPHHEGPHHEGPHHERPHHGGPHHEGPHDEMSYEEKPHDGEFQYEEPHHGACRHEGIDYEGPCCEDSQIDGEDKYPRDGERMGFKREFHGRGPGFREMDGLHRHRGHRPPMGRERLLVLIDKERQVSQNKLAAYLSIRPQSLSELLVKLERDGYILRTKNEEDKRETLVSLTEKGEARAKEVESARTQQAEAFFSPLTQEEKDTLFELLKKLFSREEEQDADREEEQ